MDLFGNVCGKLRATNFLRQKILVPKNEDFLFKPEGFAYVINSQSELYVIALLGVWHQPKGCISLIFGFDYISVMT